MIRDSSRRRDGHLRRLDESARELVAAWFVVLFVVAAGLSVLSVHQYRDVDCITAVAMPGTHHRPVADHEWDYPACAVGACGNSLSAQESDLDGTHAAQHDKGDATPVYSGRSTPVSLQGKGGDQDERLC